MFPSSLSLAREFYSITQFIHCSGKLIWSVALQPLKRSSSLKRNQSTALTRILTMYAFFAITAFFAGLSYWSVSNFSNERYFKYKSYGNPNATSIVLVPGLDGAVAFFADTIPELTASGFHVIQYFLPLKTKASIRNAYTFEFMAEDLRSVLKEAGIKNAVIVGESFG